jgi:hypothetical protein
MIDYYKLTDADGYTRRGLSGETRWAAGATVLPVGKGEAACGPGVLHFYRNPSEAQLFNPIHGNYATPRLFRVQTSHPVQTDGLKCWTTGAVVVAEELDRPSPLSTLRLVAWAILVAKTRPQTKKWNAWAETWLNGSDRSSAAAVWEAEAWEAAAASAAWLNGSDRSSEGAVLAARAAAWAAEAAAARAEPPSYPDWVALWHDAEGYVGEGIGDGTLRLVPLPSPPSCGR